MGDMSTIGLSEKAFKTGPVQLGKRDKTCRAAHIRKKTCRFAQFDSRSY